MKYRAGNENFRMETINKLKQAFEKYPTFINIK